jgi:hypothetical protein
MQTRKTVLDKLEENIIDEFRDKLKGIPKWNREKNEGMKNAQWTKEVKNAVGRILKKNSCKVCASACEQKDSGEWLYDLTGIYINEGGYFERIPLILESEWKWCKNTQEEYESEIIKDFRKLLVSRADHRVMVFEAESEEKEKEVIGRLLQHVRNCRHSAAGDRYLFVCWRLMDKKWVFDYSVYVVKG